MMAARRDLQVFLIATITTPTPEPTSPGGLVKRDAWLEPILPPTVVVREEKHEPACANKTSGDQCKGSSLDNQGLTKPNNPLKSRLEALEPEPSSVCRRVCRFGKQLTRCPGCVERHVNQTLVSPGSLLTVPVPALLTCNPLERHNPKLNPKALRLSALTSLPRPALPLAVL